MKSLLSILFFFFYIEIVELDPCTRWTLPHWCTYVAYFFCLAVGSMSILVILIQGQQFGRDVALKWLRSLFLGFIEDCFIAYPLLVSVNFYKIFG